MLKTKYIIVLVVLSVVLCVGIITMVCLPSKSQATVHTVNQIRLFPNKTVHYNRKSFEDDRMVYVVCDKELPTKCQIKREKYPYNPNAINSCNLTLDANGTVQHPQSLFEIPFGESRAIVLWYDFEKERVEIVRITVVDFNGCKQSADFILNGTSDLFDKLRSKHIVTYNNDTFDIFFHDPKQCDDVCKLNINYDGKATGQPLHFLKIDSHLMGDIHPIAAHSPAKGYVYSKYWQEKGNNVSLILVRQNGTEEHLTPMDTNIDPSIVDEMIGVCSYTSSRPDFNATNITCLQYNADGQLKINFTYNPIARPHTNTSDIHSRLGSIYTLPNQGFLLQLFETAEYPRNNQSDCKDLPKMGYHIVKLDKTGKEVGQHHFGELGDVHSKYGYRYFWKNQDKYDYCDVLINDTTIDRFNLTATCFTDAIFS